MYLYRPKSTSVDQEGQMISIYCRSMSLQNAQIVSYAADETSSF